jgi:peptidoglycan/xylan/chitin deacetylase (PgdA/CDA1 family)
VASKEYSSPYGVEGIINARSVTRHVALSSLAAFYQVTGRMSHLARPRVQFLYLHHLFPDEESPFRRLLSMLSRDHHFISYTEAVDRTLQGRIYRPYLCFSFDDGLQTCLRAARILQEFGVTGCFFICPSMVGETNQRRLKDFCREHLSLPATPLLDWDDVAALLSEGHEIGSHTMTHSVLARVSVQQLEDEIYQSRECLLERAGTAEHFAWPEGRFEHFAPAAARAVFSVGFRSCASAERGCHLTAPALRRDGLCIRRDYVAAKWPLGHVRYFLSRNSQRAEAEGSRWPEHWRAAIEGAEANL